MNKNERQFGSTYERLIHEDLEFEKDLNKRSRELVLSELLLAAMEEDHQILANPQKRRGLLRVGSPHNFVVRMGSP